VSISAAESVLRAFVVSNDPLIIQQVSEPLMDLAASTEVCLDIPNALRVVNVRKFEAVVVDLGLGEHSREILERVRLSPSNRSTVAFAITDSMKQSTLAFDAGSNFVFERPLSPTSVGRTLKAAYSLIVRERLRYFRCPLSIPAAIREKNAHKIDCQTLNISEGGVAIMTSVPMKRGTKVIFQFTIPGQSTEFSTPSEVCWSDEKNRAGLRFLAPSFELRSELRHWLARRLEATLPESVASKFRSTI
jgi:hypothetical protein